MNNQRKRILLRGAALALLSTSALAGYAFAQKGESLQPISAWSSTSVPNKGTASYCAVAQRFDGNVIMTLARNMRDETSVALDFDGAGFETGNVFQVSLDPGAGAQRSMSLKPRSEKAFVIKLGKDDDFYRAMLKTGFLRTEIGEKGYNFNLSSIDEAKSRLTDCLSQIGRPEDGVAEAEVETPAPVAGHTAALAGYAEPTPGVGEIVSAPVPSPDESKLRELSQRLAMLENESGNLRPVSATDALKEPLAPELPLERVTLKPLHDMVEVSEASVSKITPSSGTVKIRSAGRPAPAPAPSVSEDAASSYSDTGSVTSSVTKVDQSLIVEMAEENRKLKDQLAEAEIRSLDTSEMDDMKIRLRKLEAENKTLSRKLDASEAELAVSAESSALSSRDADTIAELRRQNDRLVASLATLQTAAGDDLSTSSSSSIASRETERQLSILESQNRVLTERLDSLLGQNGDYSRQIARYEMQVQELERKLADARTQSAGPNYEAMVQTLKDEIAQVQSENILLREQKSSPDPLVTAELGRLKAENDSLNRQVSKAQSELFVLKEMGQRPDPALQGEIAALEAENRLLNQQVSSAKTEILTLKSAASKPDPLLQGQLTALKNENEILSRQLADLEIDNATLKTKAGDDVAHAKQVQSLKDEIALIEEENLRLKQASAGADSKLEGQIAALKTENELLNLEIARQSDLAKAEFDDKIAGLKAENEKLQERLALYLDSPGSLVALKDEMEELKAQKEELSLTVADIQEQAKKLAALEKLNIEKTAQISKLSAELDDLKIENSGLKQAAVDTKAADAKASLSLAEYEDKIGDLTLENEGLRSEVKSLQSAQADIQALQDVNAELAALLDESEALSDEQQSALAERQAEVDSLAKAIEEGSNEEVLALEGEVKKLLEENSALKSELGEAQIEILSMKQDMGSEVSKELEENLAAAEPDVVGPVEAPQALDITEGSAATVEAAPRAVDDIVEALSIDEPLRKEAAPRQMEFAFDEPEAEDVETVAAKEVAEDVEPEVVAVKAPLPLSKPAYVAKAPQAAEEAVVAEAPKAAPKTVDEAMADVEPAAGDDVPAETLLGQEELAGDNPHSGPSPEMLHQQAVEAGLSEAQRQEMALAREMGVSAPAQDSAPAPADMEEGVDVTAELMGHPVAAPVASAIKAEDLAEPEAVATEVSDTPEAAASAALAASSSDAPAPVASSSAEFKPAMPIENILSAAQIPVAGSVKLLDDVSGPGLVAYQWESKGSAGGVFGSAQQKPVQGEGQFDTLVQDYLTKTEQRCGGEFAISPSSTQDNGGTRIDSYEIACVGGGVDSTASLLFFQQNGTFTVVAHESPTEGMASAMDYRDRMIASLRKS